MLIYILLFLLLSLAVFLRRRSSDIHSSSIPKVPSLLPWIGSAFHIALRPITFLDDCRARFGSAFKLKVAGRDLIVLSNDRGIASVLQDRHHVFSMHMLHSQMVKTIGNIEMDPVEIMEERLYPLIDNAFSKEGIIDIAPTLNNLILQHIQTVIDSPNPQTTTLSEFVGQTLYSSVSTAVWGDLYPIETFNDFDYLEKKFHILLSTQFSKVITKIPPLARNVLGARNALISSIGDFADRAWQNHKLAGASSIGMEVVEALKDLGLTRSDADGILFAFVWGLHSNVIKSTFWLFAYLLSDSIAYARIREEVDRTLEAEFDGKIDNLLSNLASRTNSHIFPLIDSAVKEALRMSVLSNSLREVIADCQVASGASASVWLYKGDLVLPDVRGVHFDEGQYEDSGNFRVDRFIRKKVRGEDPDRDHHLPLPIRPFGGGYHICKGRHFAVYQMKVFAILCVHLLDITGTHIDGSPLEGRPPQMDPCSQVGIVRPVSDLHLQLRRRAE